MNYNLNKLIEKRLSLTDCSLLSEVTDINEVSFEINVADRHVRFNTNNNNSFLNSSVISDASLLDSESRFTSITQSEVSRPIFNKDLEDNISSSKCIIAPGYSGHFNSPLTTTDHETVEEYTTIRGQEEADNDDTSVWSSGTDISNVTEGNSGDRQMKTSTPKQTLFHTIDNMRSAASTSSSSPVDTIVSDDISDRGYVKTELNLHVPMPNSSKYLKSKIEALSEDIKYHQENLSSTAKELATKKLQEQLNIKEKFTNDNSCGFVPRAAVELTQHLNIRQDVELYPELTNVNVRNESIFAAEQKKLAAIRKRVGVENIQKKVEDGLPESNLLEFFNPSKHLFKSVNLSTGPNLIGLKPTLSSVDRRHYSVFRDRDLLNTFH